MAFQRPSAEDFPQLIKQLQINGKSLRDIGMDLGGISKQTIYNWALGAVPNHPDGEALKALHRQVCGTSTETATA